MRVNKIISYIAISIGILLASQLFATSAYADSMLTVDIYDEFGRIVLVKDGSPLYASGDIILMPRPAEEKECAIYSSISDDGINYSEPMLMNENLYRLTAAEHTSGESIWIRFCARYGEEPDEPMDEGTEEPDESAKEVNIIFDTAAPYVLCEDKESMQYWTGSVRTYEMTASDDLSGIARIMVKYRDEVLYEAHDEEVKECGGCFTVDADRPSEDEYGKMIEVYIADYAGNETYEYYSYYLDSEQPNVNINTYENGTGKEGTSVDIEVSDNILACTDLAYEVTRYDGERMSVISQGNVNAAQCGGRVGFRLTEEGEYTIRAAACDAAGNSKGEQSKTVRIDTTAPVISIGGVERGRFYKNDIALQLNVAERMYEGCNVSVTLLRKTPLETVNIPVASCVMKAQEHKGIINLTNDGDYELFVAATDSAGNMSTDSMNFRIDKTPPKVAIIGADAGVELNAPPDIDMCIKELFYEDVVVNASLLKEDESGLYREVPTPLCLMSGVSERFRLPVSQEGRYRVLLSAADKAGNESSTALDFALDYTPPAISIPEGIDRAYLRNFRFPIDFMNNIVDMGRTAYRAFANMDEIHEGDEITKNGKYTLYIEASDEAGNSSESVAEFIIDNSPPRIVVTGVNSDGSVVQGSTVHISLFDSEDVLKRVTCRGRNIDITDGKSADFCVDGLGDYDISVEAYDKAGNVTNRAIHTNSVWAANPHAEYGKVERLVLKEATQQKDIGKILKIIAISIAAFSLVCAGAIAIYRASAAR